MRIPRRSKRRKPAGERGRTETCAQWRYLQHRLPLRQAVSQLAQRWITSGLFDTMVHTLGVLLRGLYGRDSYISGQPHIAQQAGKQQNAGYDRLKRKQCSKLHAAVNTISEQLALHGAGQGGRRCIDAYLSLAAGIVVTRRLIQRTRSH